MEIPCRDGYGHRGDNPFRLRRPTTSLLPMSGHWALRSILFRLIPHTDIVIYIYTSVRAVKLLLDAHCLMRLADKPFITVKGKYEEMAFTFYI